MSKLRVLVITEDDPLYVRRFFDVFFDELPKDRFELVGVTISKASTEPLLATAKRVFRFFGPVDFFKVLTRYVGVKAKGVSIGKLAHERGIPEIPATSVNDPEFVQRVKDLGVDILVSVAAPEIFKKPLLESARVMCINLHSGKLPKYRGMMPNFWQLLNQEPNAIVTVHEMVRKLDAGDILGEAPVPLRAKEPFERVMIEAKIVGARLVISVMQQIADGTIEKKPLDLSQSDYFSFPQPEDVRKLRAIGHRMI